MPVLILYYCLILRGQLNNTVKLPNSTLCLRKNWFSLHRSSEKNKHMVPFMEGEKHI